MAASHYVTATMPPAALTEEQRLAILSAAGVLRSMVEQLSPVAHLVGGELVAQGKQALDGLTSSWGVETSIAPTSANSPT